MTTAQFVDCKRLPRGSRLEIETKNRHYDIEFLGGDAIRISGHPEICPTPIACTLEGCADKGGFLEPGVITPGRHLRFVMDDHRPVITSRVLKIRVEAASGTGSVH